MKLNACLLVLLLIVGPEAGVLDRARAYLAASDWTAAIAQYELALEQYPQERPAIHFNMALAYEQMEAREQALEHYRLAIKPQHAQLAARASNNLGTLLAEDRQFQDALQAFRDALTYDEANETARYNYELLMRLLNPDADAPQPPPPPPSDGESEEEGDAPPEAQPPSSRPPGRTRQQRGRYRRPPGTEDAGAIIMDTIPLNEARRLLEQMQQNEIKFLQQLKKFPSAPLPRKDDKKDW